MPKAQPRSPGAGAGGLPRPAKGLPAGCGNADHVPNGGHGPPSTHQHQPLACSPTAAGSGIASAPRWWRGGTGGSGRGESSRLPPLANFSNWLDKKSRRGRAGFAGVRGVGCLGWFFFYSLFFFPLFFPCFFRFVGGTHELSGNSWLQILFPGRCSVVQGRLGPSWGVGATGDDASAGAPE